MKNDMKVVHMAKNRIFPVVARIAPILRLTVFLVRTVFYQKFTILTSKYRRFLAIWSHFFSFFFVYDGRTFLLS